MKISELLAPALGGIEPGLESEALLKLELLGEILGVENKKMNLTAITSPEGIARRHILDSLTLLACPVFGGEKMVDIGSGAGFPALPVAILRPDMKITCLDSSAKKIGFIELAARELGLKNVECVCGRAEELAKGEMREGFDTAVSRAVGRLNLLAELCIPFVRPGGFFIALKSNGSEEELLEAAVAVKLLGGGKINYCDWEVSPVAGSEEKLVTRLVFAEKIKTTHHAYPRRYSRMVKEPL